MRADALITLNTTAEHWTQVTTQDDSGDINVDYVFDGNITLTMLDTVNNSPIIFTRTPLTFNDKLLNIKDARGNDVFQRNGAAATYVGSGQPVFDVFGSVMGYRYIITTKFGPVI